MKTRLSDEPIACIPDFDVIAESQDWIVVSKAAPLIVHPANGKIEPNLLEGVSALLCCELAQGGQLALINRLDRETSGLTLLAKNPSATRQLGRAIQRRLMHKEYHAIVYGHPESESWIRTDPILRKGEIMQSDVWVMQCVHPEGKECKTSFRTLSRFMRQGEPFSLIHCIPETGRMHQIRVHLAASGYPIVGDKIYGPSPQCYLDYISLGWTPTLESLLKLPRHTLHASVLDFPFDDQVIHTSAPLPDDMRHFAEGS
ncbi:MAG: RluA family pseudouridine synthase [Akkermansia sp.]